MFTANVVLVLYDLAGLLLLLDLCHLGLFLACISSDVDALLAEEDQCLDDVPVVVADCLGHVGGDDEGTQSEDESLHLEVLLELGHFLHDDLEELAGGGAGLKLRQGDSVVVPEAHQDSLQEHGAVVLGVRLAELAQVLV